jgi:hypothetical protein
MHRRPRRWWSLALVGLGAAAIFSLAPRWPTDQRLRITLGDLASRAVGVRVRCGSVESRGGDDWAREATFRYAKGEAPRIVSYEPRLASGDYRVEIEVETDDAHVMTEDRQVQLAGGTTSIDLSGRGAPLTHSTEREH